MATIKKRNMFLAGNEMKIDRVVSIIMILLDKKRIGAHQLAEMFEVSPRTIYRDIDTINMAGIPVRSISGVGGGFEILPEYKLDRKVFSTSDLSAILMGLSSLSSLIRGEELINALSKVKSFIPAEKAQEIEVKRQQIHIDVSPWMGNRDLPGYLEIINSALQESRLISFDYADSQGARTTRRAEPYQLVLKGNHWYVQGFCLLRNDFRLFKLSRIVNLRLEDVTFSPREYQKPQLELAGMLETRVKYIKIRIHRSVMDRVLDFCSIEHFLPDGEEHYLVDFPFIENDFFFNILFSFGDSCECIAPPAVREEMKQRIRKLAAVYGC